jgi:hypothetical protein
MKKLTAFAALGVLLSFAGHLFAYDFYTGRSTGLGQATVLTRPSPSDLLNLPSGRLAINEWRFETGLSRAFDLPEFDQFILAAAGRRGRFGLAIGFSQFGKSELYTEQVAKLTFSMHVDSLTFAVGGSHLTVGFGGDYADLSAATLHAGTSFQRNWLTVSAGADDLTSPSLNDGSPKVQPLYTAAVEYRGRQPLSIVGRIQSQKGEGPRFSLGQHLAIGSSAALMLGIVTAPTQFGGGVEITHKGAILTFGVSVHPVLGLSQSISVSYGNKAQKNRGVSEFK